MNLPVTPAGDIKLRGAPGMLKGKTGFQSDAQKLEKWFEGKTSDGSLWAC